MSPPTTVPVAALSDTPDATRTRLEPPARGELHLWRAAVRHRPRWLELLTDAERDRAAEYAVGAPRDIFVTSYGVQRLLGAWYLGGEPARVTISRECGHCGGNHGRPRFTGADIDYSVSHTREWVLVGVTGHGRVGIDVEQLDPRREVDCLARSALTVAEWDHYRRLAPQQRLAWFMRTWTRKEAAMKLTGLGLAAWPNRIDVTGPQASAQRLPRWPTTPIHLSELPAPAGHVAALAATVPVTHVRSLALP